MQNFYPQLITLCIIMKVCQSAGSLSDLEALIGTQWHTGIRAQALFLAFQPVFPDLIDDHDVGHIDLLREKV
jgi:hypothetical protein